MIRFTRRFSLVVLLAIFAISPIALAQEPEAQYERLLATGYSPDTILVRFGPEADIEALAVSAGITEIRPIDRIDVSVCQVSEGSVLSAIETLAASGDILFAEPNYLRRTFFTPNDPRYGEQYGFQKINAENAWNITLGSSNVIVAVIDTGVDQDHPELINQRWINTDEIAGNGIDDDGNGYIDDRFGYDFFGKALFGGLLPPPEGEEDSNPEDDNGHGTHTAGTVAAETDNATGVAGTASGCKVMVIRALGGLLGFGYSSDIMKAMVYAADNGAHVISMSLGSTQFSSAELAVAAYCTTNDVLIVAAAGNGGNAQVNYPAGYPQVMAVSASNQSDNIASFSTTGVNIDVAAPGAGVLSTWKGAGYKSADGTSMACPHAAGVCALVRSQFPAINADQARLMVRDGATDLGAAGWDSKYGDGRLEAYGALTASVPDPAQVRLFSPGNGGFINTGNTPFGFGWSRVTGAASYAIQFELPSTNVVTVPGITKSHFYAPASVWTNVPAGQYRWRVGALNGNNAVISVSSWWTFSK
jgi:subtilisin family serine protease